MASLSLRHINKTYPNGFVAVKDFNLEIADKEFIIFVGPSGCGKSTLLEIYQDYLKETGVEDNQIISITSTQDEQVTVNQCGSRANFINQK